MDKRKNSIIEARVKKAGENQSELSRATGIHLSHINRILSGKRGVSTRNLEVLSVHLDIPMGDLYTYFKSVRARAKRRMSTAA